MASSTAANSPNAMNLVFMNDISYNENVIRINTDTSVVLEFTRKVSKYIYLGIIFDYLVNEVFKTFSPTCTLYEWTGTAAIGANLISTCTKIGHRLDMYIQEDLLTTKKYKLYIFQIPNPDNGFCDPIPFRVIVSNAQQTKTLLQSSNFVSSIA